MFTSNGQRFTSVAIARLVLVEGWTHVPAAVDGQGGCTWAVERREVDEYGELFEWIADCGAELAYTEDRWVCAAGHEHVSAEARQAEGWDYAEDAYDAAVITLGGRLPVPMGPSISWDDREVARVMAQI